MRALIQRGIWSAIHIIYSNKIILLIKYLYKLLERFSFFEIIISNAVYNLLYNVLAIYSPQMFGNNFYVRQRMSIFLLPR